MTTKRLICKYVAGSHAYGLQIPSSDIDYRGVYLSNHLGQILDPYQFHASHKTEVNLTEEIDESYFELRHFLHILRATNSNAVEMLFNEKWELTTSEWCKITKQRHHLLDPEKLYRSLKGYILSELRLATGERTGRLGAKRQKQVAICGFSPKNFVQLLRLCFAGVIFFEQGIFPVDMNTYPAMRTLLMDIKTIPASYTKEQLVSIVANYERTFDNAYTTNISRINSLFKFDEAVANKLILDAYFPILKRAYKGKTGLFKWW